MEKTAFMLAPALIQPSRVVGPPAWVGHIPFASWILARQRPAIFVELGTHSGNSYLAFCQAVQENGLDTKCYAVDTWQGDEHAGRYENAVFNELSEYHNKNYGVFSQLLRMTFDDALSYFSDDSIDLLHIDGLHTYEAVKHDFETWLPKLTTRGVVLFHDTNVRESGFGVWKLWEELSAQYPCMHFEHSHGLGVLFVGKDISPEIQDMLRAYQAEASVIRRLFAYLGQRISQQFDLTVLNQAVTLRDGQIANLFQAVADREAQVHQAVAERDAQLAVYYQAVAERDAQLAALHQAVAALHQAVAECGAQIAGYRETIQKIHRSHSWRLTRPLRFVARLLSGRLGKN